MSARSFIYRTIINTPEVTALVGDTNPRVFAKKSMTSNVEEHPFIVYKLGNETPEMMNEQLEVTSQYFQVWVHDYHDTVMADYDRIDQIILALRKAFWLKGSKEENVWDTSWVETSQDLNDETLNTVFKYVRFRLIRRAQ